MLLVCLAKAFGFLLICFLVDTMILISSFNLATAILLVPCNFIALGLVLGNERDIPVDDDPV